MIKILMIFIGLIIAVVLLQSVADQVFNTTTTLTATNNTVTTPANGTTASLTGRTLIGTATVTNGSTPVASTNVTVATALVSGVETITVTVNNASFANLALNFSYNFEPDGFLQSGSSRAIIVLVTLFGALAALIFVIGLTISMLRDAGLIGGRNK